MMPGIQVKICGLTTPGQVACAVAAGARYLGFVFFAKSPRNLSVPKAAALARGVPPGVARVGLVVNAGDAVLDEITATVPLDMLQLHGNEPPERVAELRARYGLPVMKAIGISGPGDVARIDAYAPVADQLLIDAKPPTGAALPGGMGVPFDWRLIAGRHWARPWMLAGGLTPENVALALRLTGARQVDVSSGVESAPGVKDEGLIRAFIAAVS
ncbi:MAG: phosphoribosylanthranilate isomerase [Rhodobacterales bacterium]|nr:MAG: phosphoribosylanthranilate isomerase [Rhodobacterales bacterium]